MPKQLTEPHFLLAVIFMLIVGGAWFLGKVDATVALPLLAAAAFGSIGSALSASNITKGINIGVPLSPPAVTLPAVLESTSAEVKS